MVKILMVFFFYIFYQICDFTAFYDILLGKYGKLGKTHEILVSQNEATGGIAIDTVTLWHLLEEAQEPTWPKLAEGHCGSSLCREVQHAWWPKNQWIV